MQDTRSGSRRNARPLNSVVPDPFDMLGLAPRFDLMPDQVERAYLARAAKVHPDLVGRGEEAERQAAELAAARATLDDPESRANALLARLGGPSKEADRSLPAGFLATIMELREQVEEAMASGDPVERKRQQGFAQERRREYMERVGGLFQAYETSHDSAVLASIRRELNAWRYIERLIEQLDPGYDPAKADFAPRGG